MEDYGSSKTGKMPKTKTSAGGYAQLKAGYLAQRPGEAGAETMRCIKSKGRSRQFEAVLGDGAKHGSYEKVTDASADVNCGANKIRQADHREGFTQE